MDNWGKCIPIDLRDLKRVRCQDFLRASDDFLWSECTSVAVVERKGFERSPHSAQGIMSRTLGLRTWLALAVVCRSGRDRFPLG